MRRRSRTIRWSILAFAGVLGLPGRAAAQEVERAVIGGGVGVLGGVAITMATVVARGQFQSEYRHEPGDLIHWQSGAMIAAPAAGVAFGLRGRDALVGSVVGSVSGLVVGSGLGVAVGSP